MSHVHIPSLHGRLYNSKSDQSILWWNIRYIHLEAFDVFANFLNDPDTLVPKNDISVFMMRVRSAKSWMGDFHQDFTGRKIIFVCGGFNNFSLLWAFVDSKFDAHGGACSNENSGLEAWNQV
jgi:hypothetical protein